MSSNENSFEDILPLSRGYSLSQVRLEMASPALAIFKAKLNGPEGLPVWARAWLSTEAGTLAELASPQLKAGDEVTLEVALRGAIAPQFAYMRIESAPLHTSTLLCESSLEICCSMRYKNQPNTSLEPTMKKIVTLLSGCLIALAAVASDSSASQIFQMRLVADKLSADSEQMVLVRKVDDKSIDQTLYVQKKVLLDQTALKSAKVITDSRGQRQIEITFTKVGRERFAEVTRDSINKRLAIIIDGHLYEAPIIRTEISGGIADISGNFSKQEAELLASKIRESWTKQ